MQVNKYDVYIRLDEHGAIKKMFCSVFEDVNENDILIDSGYGDKYHHCQNCYLDDKTFDNNYNPNFKYVDGTIFKITDEEKKMWYPKKTEPYVDEVTALKQRQDVSENALQELILMMMGGVE